MASTAKKTKQAPPPAAAKPLTKPLPVVLLPIAKIDPATENRDAAIGIEELAANIKEFGQQQPIKVRPKGDRYEIIFGERRWRAVKSLGFKDISATVDDCDESTAVILRATENLQRKDPHPLEEAEIYEQLLARRDSKGKPEHTPESIATEIAGKSASYVYQRLKLTALAPVMRKAVYADKLSVGSAFLIARGIPTSLQDEAWTKLEQVIEDEATNEDFDDDGRLNKAAVEAFIERHYATRLDMAPFGRKDAKLLAAAGSCDACPKRSGNQRHLFGAEDHKETCTDLTCYRAKVAAFIQREKDRVLAEGGKVMTDEESRKIFQGASTLPYGSNWVDLNQPRPVAGGEAQNLRKVMGDLCPPGNLAFTSQGKPVLLAEKTTIVTILTAHGFDPQTLRKVGDKPKAKAPEATSAAAKPVHPDDPEDEDLDDDGDDALDQDSGLTTPARSGAPDPAEIRLKADIERVTRQRIMGAVVAAAEAASADDNRFVKIVYETTLHGGFSNAICDTVKRRVESRPKNEHAPETLAKHVAGLTAQQLRGLVLELALSRSAYFVNAKLPHDLQTAVDLYGIKADEIEKTVTDELTAKRAARLAKPKAGGA